MALSVSQIVAMSYNSVANDKNKAENQWAESALMQEFESQGMIKRVSFGPQIEETLDYQRNPGTDFLATDFTPTSSSKTEVATAALYDIGQLTVPVTWSRGDEVKNPTENQKVDFVTTLLDNGFSSHDDAVEEAIFATSTDGFLGVGTIIDTAGTGTVGGINSTLETWWRNGADTYAADGSDIDAVFTELYNGAAKGSGSALAPSLMFSGSDPHALFESTQIPQQRYAGQEIRAGAKVLIFKTCRFVFSQYGDERVFFSNKRSLRLKVSKQAYRQKGETMPLENVEGYKFSIYSALQLVTNNRSRLAVADLA